MFRRLVAAVVLALATIAGGGGVAYAAESAPPAAGGWCARPPTPNPLDSLSDKLDITAPTTFGTGLYSTYGWTAFTTSTVYDPGCWNTLLGKVADALPTSLPGVAAAGSSDVGPNRVTGWGLAFMVFATSLAPTAVRLAVGDGSVWRVMDTVEASLRLVTGANVLIAFVSLSCALTGLWFLARARTDPLADTMNRTLTALFLLAAGAAITLYQVTGAPTVDRAVQSSFVAAGQVATGQTDPATGKVDAGTIVADALAEGLVLKVWGVVHLGPDMAVVDEYAPRLLAAQAYTRSEAAQAATDLDYRKTLVAAKKADYEKVAAEIKTTHPDAYDWLSKGADRRAVWAWVGFFAAALVTTVIGGVAVVVAAARLGIRLLVGAFPGIAALTMIPPLQKFGRLATEWAVKLPFIAAVATGALMIFVRCVMDILTVQGEPWFTVLAGLCIVCGLLVWLWGRREAIAKAAGVADQKHAADRAARIAADVATDAASAAAAAGRKAGSVVAEAAGRDWDRRNEWRTHPDDYTPITDDPRPTPPPTVKAPAEAAAVRKAATRDLEQRAEKARSSTTPDRVTATAAKAKAARVQDAAAVFTGRPTEDALRRREAMHLAARTARSMPAKATTATTHVAARAVSRATVASAVKVMAPRTPTSTAANAALALARK